MDRIKKQRAPVRASITRTVGEVEVECEKAVPDEDQLNFLLTKLERLREDINELDKGLLDQILDSDGTDEQFSLESAAIEEYSDRLTKAICKLNKKLNPLRPSSRSPTPSDHNTQTSVSRRNYSLPKLEIKKFDGELKNWLSFWAQFQKVHEDESLPDGDKFQYLMQSIQDGTRARKLVESYPQTATNYPKVIAALEDRFGDKVLLSELYVRELLKFVDSPHTSSLSSLYDELESHLRSLESLEVSIENSAIFLLPMIESSLPLELIKVWQRSSIGSYDREEEGEPETPNKRLKNLMRFLGKEVKGEERLLLVKQDIGSAPRVNTQHEHKKERKRNSEQDIPTVSGLFIGEKNKCLFCEKGHESKDCWKAQSLSADEKSKIVREKRSCFSCLKPGHLARDCRGKVKCSNCGKKHFVIMCPSLNNVKNPKNENYPCPQNTPISPSSSHTKNVSANLACSRETILKTVWVTVVGGRGEARVRAIIDDGSQRSYISKDVAEKVGLKCSGIEKLKHTLFGGVETSTESFRKFLVQVKSGQGVKEFEALEKTSICGELPRVNKGGWMRVLKKSKIHVSDIGDGCPKIDMLIGAKELPSLLTGNVKKLKEDLIAIETVMGWALMGRNPSSLSKNTENPVAMTVACMQVMQSSIQQLWELDTLGIKDPSEVKSREVLEAEAKEHFLKTVSKTEGGRYVVKLPWVEGRQIIPDNRATAQVRLESTTRRLKSIGMYNQYNNVFRGWAEEGIIEEVKKEEETLPSYYLPHRAVVKLESSTTPVRPVFDASCKTGRSPSLNECLEKGPNLIELIPSILLRFREGRVGVVSDIRKAFLMIEMHKEDRDHLRFLWWEDESCQKVIVLRHKRVVFGVNSSPFLLGAVLELHLSKVKEEEREIAQKLLKSLYVDNCVTSVSSHEEYEDFRVRATEILARAGMELRLWQCSSVESSGIGSSTSDECGLEGGRDESDVVSVLGLSWNRKEDTLSCDIKIEENTSKVTKRSVLSRAQKIFDPMGYLCPALLFPKLILQEAWAQKYGWDEKIGEENEERFREWSRDLHYLSEVKIPRNFNKNIEKSSWQLHCFVDASKVAYAAAVFLRAGEEGNISVQLLQAKSRVSPLKSVSIPRLELLGCLIGARLTASIKKALELENTPTYYWTDSSTALAWIRGNDQWGTFVGNRVREIVDTTKVREWNFVPGVQNPADLPSRGCRAQDLVKSRWWEGPSWLREEEESWPREEEEADEEMVRVELKKSVVQTLHIAEVESEFFLKSSSYTKNIRILAWVRRFISKLRKSEFRQGHLTVEEIVESERELLKLVQKEAFAPTHYKLPGFFLNRDEDGLYRARTKLLQSEEELGFKNPILLPHTHPIVDLLIREEHEKNGHAGAQLLIGRLREKYWILQTRKAVRRVIKSCVTCRRFNSKKIEVVPGPLPLDRVKIGSVFETVGVDLAGPLYIRKKKKAYIVIFTCAVYRAIHLEMVKQLSTESFLEAFNRFTSRRGRPSIIYSDNGTNFHGAENLFGQLDWEKISRDTSIHRIIWKFNPPSAAWWGGWWERLVRSVKDVLKRVLKKSSLSYDKLRNVLCETESFINARPLTTVTEDPDDLRPLTPSLFMHEMPLPLPSDLELLDASGFQKLNVERKRVSTELKMRFRKEYLSQLVQKGKEPTSVVREGDIVLVASDNRKRWEWPLAKVLRLIPGKDSNVRVAEVRTATGILTRPLQRLYPLEVSSHSKDEEEVEVEAEDENKDEAEAAAGSEAELQTKDEAKQKRGRGRPPKPKGVVLEEPESAPVFTRSGRKITPPIK